VNFFQPQMRLVEKTRRGAKVHRRHDLARTPYQRILDAPQIPAAIKDRLRAQYVSLNPVELKRRLARCQDELLAASKRKSLETRKEVRTSPTHPWKTTLWPEKTPLGGHSS
jgi:hypothetical protein